jgi:hypothetical protein
MSDAGMVRVFQPDARAGDAKKEGMMPINREKMTRRNKMQGQ